MIDSQAAAQACENIAKRLAALPVEVLREAKRRAEIEAHNAEVDRKKAEREKEKRSRKMAKKRAENAARAAKENKFIAFAHPSAELDLRG